MDNKTTVDQLPEPLSRSEEFLDFIARGKTTVDQLPTPLSRIEQFLDCIARNGGGGGGTGGISATDVRKMIADLIKEVRLDGSDLVFTRYDSSEFNVSLASLGGNVSGNGYVNATFDSATNIIKLIKSDGSETPLELGEIARLNVENFFTEDINFVPTTIKQVVETPNGTPLSYCMDRYVRVEAFKTIAKLGVQIRGFNGASVVPTNVKVYAINADNHQIIEVLHDGTNNVPIETIDGVRYAVINVNKSYDVNTVFAFRIDRQGNYGSGSGVAIQENTDKNMLYTNTQPVIGMRFEGITSASWTMGIYIKFASIKVGEMVKALADQVGQYNSEDNEYQIFSSIRGDFNNSTGFRIPAVTITSNGNIVSAADIRYNTLFDQSKIDNGISLSKDGGKTWSQQIAMRGFGTDNITRVMDSTILSSNSGRVFVLCGSWTGGNANQNWESATEMPHSIWSARLAVSNDNGETWTERVIAGYDFDNGNQLVQLNGAPQNMVSFLGGVGAGIQHSSGRLIFPVQVLTRDVNAGRNSVAATIIYSDDDGNTWTMASGFTPERVSENMVAEDDNGNLVLFGRANRNTRPMYISHDMGGTWETHPKLHNVINFASQCQGSLISLRTSNGYHIGLASGPSKSGRRDYIVRLVNFSTGEVVNLLNFFRKAGNGYTCLAHGYINNEPRLVVVYEAQGQIHYQDLTHILSRIDAICADYNCVKEWEDLEFTSTTIDFTNLATDAEMRVGQITGSGSVNTSDTWRRIYIPVENGHTYRIMNKRGETQGTASNILGSGHFILVGEDKTTFISSQSTSYGNIFGRRYIEFTVNNENAKYLVFNLYNAPNDQNWSNPTPFEELMVWDVEQVPDKPFIEGITVKSVILDGGKIHTTFTSTTGLTSTTVSKALDELNEKIGNSGTGTVTSVNGWLPDSAGNIDLLIITTDEIDAIISSLE